MRQVNVVAQLVQLRARQQTQDQGLQDLLVGVLVELVDVVVGHAYAPDLDGPSFGVVSLSTGERLIDGRLLRVESAGVRMRCGDGVAE
ncbi:hypothetical protein AB0C04_29140 [Micromonospora sp. NPDC048909]|uniref:hypothetical protein n=1 Tax=Micromonospora sp. NPDC048909 TaxID=3155643 RepID=UPI0033FBB7DA